MFKEAAFSSLFIGIALAILAFMFLALIVIGVTFSSLFIGIALAIKGLSREFQLAYSLSVPFSSG